jgi:hypothetical protein
LNGTSNIKVESWSFAADGTLSIVVASSRDDQGTPLLKVVDVTGRPLVPRDVSAATPVGSTRQFTFRFNTERPPVGDWPSYRVSLEHPDAAQPLWIAPAAPPTGSPRQTAPAVAPPGLIDIDYTARDFASLSAVIGARLAQDMPGDWANSSEHPADPMITIADVLATRGDYLSYFQDAIGTEAYLSTARTRLSVRRHARLLDYAVNDGCNARTWLAFTVDTDVVLRAGQAAVTPQPGQSGIAVPVGALAADTTVFETLEPLTAFAALNDLGSQLMRAQPYVIARDDWSLDLPGLVPALVPGRVLVFEQIISPDAGPAFGAHAVRLLQVRPWQDSQGNWMTRIVWHPEDRMPRPLTVPAAGAGLLTLYGNVALADHGLSRDTTLRTPAVAGEPAILVTADPVFAAPPPQLPAGWDGTQDPAESAALVTSAAASLAPDPRSAVAQVELNDGGAIWRAARDLLRAPAGARLFAVEPDDRSSNDGGQRLLLRFGDGVLGRPLPVDATFAARVRVGLGQTGQVKPRLLVQLLDPPNQCRRVSNPLPAAPTPAETTAAVRLFASRAFRLQQRGITPDDWEDLGRHHPLVTAISASAPGPDDTGCLVAVETDFYTIVRDYLLGFAVIGAPPTIIELAQAPLDIALAVYCRRNADLASLRQRLGQRLGSGHLPDGSPAFFNPQRLQPGRPIMLADLIAAIRQEDGVSWINLDPATDPRIRFGRLDHRPDEARAGFARGTIPIAPTERGHVGGDRAGPQQGRLQIYVIAE